MEKIYFFLLFLILSFSSLFCFSQSKTEAEVSVYSVEYIDKTIHIYYDIIDSQEEDLLTVRLLVLDSLGNDLNVRAFEGDIGANVPGGSEKHISWKPALDHIYLDANISFEVYADYMVLPDKETVPAYSRAGLITQSLLVPGLGMTKITGKPHWLRAVAGYGCLGSAIYFSQKAKQSYESVSDVSAFDDKTELYDQSIQQDQTSEILFYAAAGVWVTDIIWTLVGTKDYKAKSKSGSYRGLTVTGSMDPVHAIPKILLRYRF